jgi:undecaprenyl-diphosphatase
MISQVDAVLMLGGLLVILLVLWRVTWWMGRALARGLARLWTSRPAGAARLRAVPAREAFARRWPRSEAALAARLRTDRFTGLPLTLFALGAAYLAALLAGLVQEVLEAEELVALDEAINEGLNAVRVEAMVLVFAWITTLGESAARIAVGVVATGFLWAHGPRRLVGPLWLVFLGTEIFTWIGKFGFDRARPEFVTEITALSPSFPSGHTTGATAIFGFVAYAVARDLPRARQRYDVAYWTVVLIVLVGASRMVLGVHYLSDVLSGLLLGALWLLVGFAAAELLRARGGVSSGAV